MKRAQFNEISNRDLDSKFNLPAEVFRSFIHLLFIFFYFCFWFFEKVMLVFVEIDVK